MISRVHDAMHAQYTSHAFGKGDTPELQQLLLTNGKKLLDFLGEKNFMVGDNLVFSDFSLFELIECMEWMSKGDVFNTYPKLKEYCDRIKSLPNFKEYWEDDEKCIKRPYRLLHA